ncbi:SDR family oxidoreductase [Christiangramia forsetii]|uniref:Short-chain dehydrogenase/reductase family protein n=2 Tax=Christiangramia forsetii TaxID=411153 RepID=A0M1K3_CHRFK|nr:SDR family oxidoreductase [Christiangramia forsetii]GGG42315.1 short-chain dehydrogenase [Christiangramia forsetii]CAL66498.1 short-chain dehydrogenase/reductase family protein [Christiangramia forsetii KT0803]
MSTNKKTALITGGSKGIGYGVAETLLKMGYKVAITSRSLSSAEKAAGELSKHGEALGLEADVRNFDSQQKAVDQLINKWGQLDVLVANAGIGNFGSVEDLTVEEWKDTIDTNLTGVFFSIKACVDALKKSEGYIITISSLAGTNFFAGGAAYNASKFGVTGFTQAVMLDLRDKGVKVSTIMPGSVATHFNDHEPSEADAWKIQSEDIGELVGDLLKMNPRTLPSKIEVRPSKPPKK